MTNRHPLNSNLILSFNNTWQDIPVLNCHDGVIVNYLDRIYKVIEKALMIHPRTLAIRCDLTFPAFTFDPDKASISRFIESFKAQIRADRLRKLKEGKRVHFSDVNYIWVKECSSSDNWHYHVCLLVNKDAYSTLGAIKSLEGNDDVDNPLMQIGRLSAQNMADRIRMAWASALGMRVEHTAGLVHFPDNNIYHLDVNSIGFRVAHASLFTRLSYFAKTNTKNYGDRSNNFGSSRT